MSRFFKRFLCLAVVFAMLIPLYSFPLVSADSGAKPIALNTQTIDNLSTINEVDRFEFSTLAPGAVTVNFKHNRVDSGGWVVNLYNENDEVLTGFTSNEADVDMTTWPVRIPAGRYYIRVSSRSSYHFSGIDYRLTVGYVDESDPKFEKQPNGNRNNAYKIDVNKTYIGNIEVQNDIDYYTFTNSAPGAVTVNFKHNRVDSGGWIVNLYNENDEVITGFTSNEADVDLTTWTVRIPAGTYYIKVNSRSSYHFSGIDYRLTVNYINESDGKFEKEPNENRNTAYKISVNKTYIGNIQVQNDIDYYTFTTAAPGAVTVNFKHNRVDSGGWIVNLYNENDEVITGFTSNEADVDLTTWTVRIPAGTYYIKVNSRSLYHFNGVDYRLTVNYVNESDPKFEKQPNGNRNNAYKIDVNKTYIGNIEVQNDIDYYTFTVKKAVKITLNFKHKQVNSGGWTISLFNQNDALVASFTSNETDVDLTTNKISVPAGTYYLKINSKSPYSFNGIDYHFRVDCPELLQPIQVKLNDGVVKISPAPVLSGKVVIAHGQALSKALGAAYSFDSKKNTITIKKSKIIITYTMGSKTAVVNGKKVTLDTAPVLIDKAPFIDIKSIATNLGYKYSYNADARVVSIK